ncbi:extracellular solute-binding protein [Vibrio sp. Isolate24]|uniref:ABC transporter substrate-binding protein n=1 Tax=Vibrio sp. Isolate24 TaxID=2908534 RepID=UPI001EFCBA50|nr:extracellular solute-binding protein [Vibrio sp. Isolate24]MCG9677540.1 extracellular solute-binding protein [Vibrio sp. Isolate24]
MKQALVLLVPTLLLAGCGGEHTSSSSDRTQVTILGTIKAEIGPHFEQALETYNASQSEYEIVSLPIDGNTYEKMTALYASNNAPTIMVMGQEAQELKDRLMDFSQSELIKNAYPGTYDVVKDGERVLGVPITVESFGFLYNKAVLDQAVGGEFNPSTINTQEKLAKLFEQISALDNVDAVSVSPMDWSLGAHFSNVLFANQGNGLAANLEALEAIKAGEISLQKNDVYNGWVDTFDLMKEYNRSKRSPLAPTYDESAMALAQGQVGMWFQGNWAYAILNELNADGEFGILPVPVNNDEDFKGNNALSVGVPMYFTIDAAQSTEAEREGAQDFLNWLFTSEAGIDAYVNKMNFIPVYENITIEPADELSRTILAKMQAGETLNWINMYYPGDAFPSMGASMQKYLGDVIDRPALAGELEKYWTSK